MKKITLIIILLCFISGCGTANYIDPEDRCIVTSVGVIKQSEGVVCMVEATDKDGAVVYIGKGDTLANAIDNAIMKISGEIIFSQCPLILLDDSVDKIVLEQIFEICISEYDFSLSIQLINCNVTEIYKRKTSEISLGYEIIKTVNYTDKNIAKYGRFANIFNDNINVSKFRLPHLLINDGALEVDGLSVYENGVKTNFLNIKVVKNENS